MILWTTANSILHPNISQDLILCVSTYHIGIALALIAGSTQARNPQRRQGTESAERTGALAHARARQLAAESCSIIIANRILLPMRIGGIIENVDLPLAALAVYTVIAAWRLRLNVCLREHDC